MTPWEFALHTTGAKQDKAFAHRVRQKKYSQTEQGKAVKREYFKRRYATNEEYRTARREQAREAWHRLKVEDPERYRAICDRIIARDKEKRLKKAQEKANARNRPSGP